MTVYPMAIDGDAELIRVDDDITEIGGLAINQLRSAVFAIEATLGINPQGSVSSVANRLDVSLNANGSIKASALTSVGLATLPIVDNQVANNAGIKEIKLALDFKTADLHTLIISNKALLDSVSAFVVITNTDLLTHIAGGVVLSDGSTPGRHVASQIDINAVPSDPRDPTFVWTGLKDKNGVLRTATQTASALLQINDDLTAHENAVLGAHVATAVSVDTTNFSQIPATATNVQLALDAIDDGEALLMGIHRANMHTNGVPDAARSFTMDGYNVNVVPPTLCEAFLVHPPATSPIDSNTQGDDVIKFLPDNTGFVFDSQFGQVHPGDILTINYGNGISAVYLVDSIRFTPASEWFIRINGYNLFDSTTDGYSYARIDRPFYDDNTAGVLAVAAANNNIDPTLLGSVIVSSPRGANALGIGFEPGQLNSSHYNLYLNIYPTGNPADKVLQLPAIDVTGNAGATPGEYTLDSVIDQTNRALRAAGFNYRMIAYDHKGNFGVMLADAIGGAGFSIINGSVGGTTISEGIYVKNVVGDATDGADALGLGQNRAAIASPAYTGSFSATEAAVNFPTKVILPLKRRQYVVNGSLRDELAAGFLTNQDGYWPATIFSKTIVGITTVETVYKIDLDLSEAELKSGKTIVVQPDIGFTDAGYVDFDYGRFIIKAVVFTAPCDASVGPTYITVVNSVYGYGAPIGPVSGPPLPVRLYFSEDSVGFNQSNIIDPVAPSVTYNRFHEIYVTDEGKTFSHERARLPHQAESDPLYPSLLGTNVAWTIKNVSAKLRGFRDTSSTALNKYVRFYVLNYDTTSGEYDGYLGKRSATNNDITNFGIVSTGRKNVVTRFYDETNVDYIDLLFTDPNASPGLDIMSTNAPRYVDIEIFASLELDEEVFLLATCEVEGPDIQAVTDRREFGSVSEENFTDSAIDFIRAGDRHLHANGVIRGLTYGGTGTAAGELLFNGGIALVNGNICAVNNGSVRIPQISETGVVLPQTLTWAVCINDECNFETILITATKEQFFSASGNHYVPSVTFVELINSRKDLTPIALVNVTIASITINRVDDARRIVLSETQNIPLTWVPVDRAIVGHFDSFQAVKVWVDNYGAANNTVTVRGSIDVASTIDMSDFAYPVTFVGEGGTFNVTAAKGFLVGSNVAFKHVNFTYDPVGVVYTALNKVNTGNGVLYRGLATSESLVDFVVEDCKFTSLVTGIQRPPFINIETDNESVIDGLIVRRCIFSDETTTPTAAAVAVINTNLNTATSAAVIANSIIEDNICNINQSIYITTKIDGGGNAVLPGINAINTVIARNNCGTIGFVVSDYFTVARDVRGSGRQGGLEIRENNCHYIANIAANGFFFTAITPTTGLVKIVGNTTSWIHVSNIIGTSGFVIAGLEISGNNLAAFNTAYLLSFGLGSNYAIFVGGTTNLNACIVANNIIGARNDAEAASQEYETGIVVFPGAIITGNYISGIHTIGATILAGIHMVVGSPVLPVVLPTYTISDNQFNRGATVLVSYVAMLFSNGEFVDNSFDSFTPDGVITNTAVITNFSPSQWVVERNRNQTVFAPIYGDNGIYTINGLNIFGPTAVPGSRPDNSYIVIADSGTNAALMAYVDFPALQIFRWTASLSSVMSNGALPKFIALTFSGTDATPDIATVQLSLVDRTNTIATDTTVITNITVAPQTIILIPTSTKSWSALPAHIIVVEVVLQDATTANGVSVGPINMIYRY